MPQRFAHYSLMFDEAEKDGAPVLTGAPDLTALAFLWVVPTFSPRSGAALDANGGLSTPACRRFGRRFSSDRFSNEEKQQHGASVGAGSLPGPCTFLRIGAECACTQACSN